MNFVVVETTAYQIVNKNAWYKTPMSQHGQVKLTVLYRESVEHIGIILLEKKQAARQI